MTAFPFDTVLVANRGEIALRVIRSIHKLGLKSVAVFSEPDLHAPHVAAADRAICIGGGPARSSYLSAEAVIAAAHAMGAGAIHPGYGFLSENAEFAEQCAVAGLVFVGPGAEAIRAMGNKRLAKERMLAAGVPCIPGYLGQGQDVAACRAVARDIGYPVMVKAAAGGGGRGMRLVAREADLAAALEGAASEALNAFGDGTVYLEKALRGARHVEVQIIADRFGKTLHLGERDCSIQRRHQKIVEETPSPAVNADLRARMTADAIAAAKAIGYENAGTIEFLLDADGRYYFLEMNTRLQVEHPVTEMVTGLDLVELQLRIAAGEPLPIDQDDVRPHGHAMEVRLCAEDPANGFLPQTGVVAVWQPSVGESVRTDSGIRQGQTISSFYDSMLAKVIAHGRTREEARRRLAAAVERTVALGVPTNKDYLARILRHAEFASGSATTEFVAKLESQATPESPSALTAVAALLFCWPAGYSVAQWQKSGEGRWSVRLAEGLINVRRGRDGNARVEVNGAAHAIQPVEATDDALTVVIGNTREQVRFHRTDTSVEVAGFGCTRRYQEHFPDRTRSDAAAGDEQLLAPMSGRVLRVNVAAGSTVQAGECVLIVEAMKMECEVRTRAGGVVDAVNVAVGAQVATRQLLAIVRVASRSATA